MGALQAYTQAIPQMAAQGQDPTVIVTRIAEVIKQRQKGRTLEDVIQDVFAPENPPAGAAQSVEQSPVSPSAPGAPAGGPPESEIGQGEPQMSGAGMTTPRPELQSLLSSLNVSGKGNASVRTINRRQVG